MPPEAIFWFKPSYERVMWFVIAFSLLAFLLVLIRSIHARLQKREEIRQVEKKIEQADLKDRPEEAVIHGLIERYHIHPPAVLLESLTFFDQIASQEIARLETVRMPLDDRIDQIEYLYSIRIQAFSDDYSLSGIDHLLQRDTSQTGLGLSGVSGDQSEVQPIGEDVPVSDQTESETGIGVQGLPAQEGEQGDSEVDSSDDAAVDSAEDLESETEAISEDSGENAESEVHLSDEEEQLFESLMSMGFDGEEDVEEQSKTDAE